MTADPLAYLVLGIVSFMAGAACGCLAIVLLTADNTPVVLEFDQWDQWAAAS